MMSYLIGKLAFVRGNLATVMVGGVGYQVQVSALTLGRMALEEEVSLYVHTHVREDALVLFGFLSLDELEMFELLISVSGIGPKVALSVLTIADPKTIRTAVVNKDPSILTSVSGVGKKTAERVILELQNKVDELDIHDSSEAQTDKETLEALVALGYTTSQAREALKGISSDVTDVSQRIRLALQSLGK